MEIGSLRTGWIEIKTSERSQPPAGARVYRASWNYEKMRIGLIDVDGHNFPNLPLMKLSAYHKKRGDSAEWYDPLTAWKNPPDQMTTCYSQVCSKKKEILWMNFEPAVQISLFG